MWGHLAGLRKQLQELRGSGETFCAAHGQQEGYPGQNPIGGSTWWDMNFFKGILKPSLLLGWDSTQANMTVG